jgi:hypothetical protein
MAPKKPDFKTAAPGNMSKSTGGVKKRQYMKVRFLENGLLDVERKNGKYLKM